MSYLFRYLRFRMEVFVKTLSLTTLFLALMQLISFRWGMIAFYLVSFCAYLWLLKQINPEVELRGMFKKTKAPDFSLAPPKEELSESESSVLRKWQWQLALFFGVILGAPAVLTVWYLALAAFCVGFFTLFLLLRVYLHFSERQARRISAYYEKQASLHK